MKITTGLIYISRYWWQFTEEKQSPCIIVNALIFYWMKTQLLKITHKWTFILWPWRMKSFWTGMKLHKVLLTCLYYNNSKKSNHTFCHQVIFYVATSTTSMWSTCFKGHFILFCVIDCKIKHTSFQESSLTMGNYSQWSMMQSTHGLISSLECSFPLLMLCCKHSTFLFVAAQLFMSLCCEPDLWNLS